MTPARAMPTKAFKTTRSGIVRTCFSVCATKIHPRKIRRKRDADRDMTVLLPTRSAMGPQTRTKSTWVTLLSTTIPMTTGNSISSSVSMYTTKNGMAMLEATPHTHRKRNS